MVVTVAADAPEGLQFWGKWYLIYVKRGNLLLISKQ